MPRHQTGLNGIHIAIHKGSIKYDDMPNKGERIFLVVVVVGKPIRPNVSPGGVLREGGVTMKETTSN